MSSYVHLSTHTQKTFLQKIKTMAICLREATSDKRFWNNIRIKNSHILVLVKI